MNMTTTDTKQTVEAMILRPIRIAAQARADEQARELAAVARAVLIKASESAEPSEDGVAHPASRPSNVGRQRIRFRMDREQHAVVKDRIRRSGQSMTAALEQGLEDYARTGKF
jgi:hypothetical protein